MGPHQAYGAMANYGMVDERTQEELKAWLRLATEPGLNRGAVRHLLKEFGLPQHVLRASPEALSRHVSAQAAAALLAPPLAETRAAIDAALRMLQLPGHHLITLADVLYPASLLDTDDPPVLLYVRGDPQLLHRPAVAIVGARSATDGGKDNARAFARHLAERGWAIVSGMARGIDAAAHEGALQAGPDSGGTIAVLASGLDIVYPRQNSALAERISTAGTLVTEYPPGTPALPFRFPERNRLVAALSRGVLVVEAAVQSGSLVTARLALECGREVFAIPGSIHAPLSRGCHALIRQGAKLVEQGRDIEEELQRAGPAPLMPQAGAFAIPGMEPATGRRRTGASDHGDGGSRITAAPVARPATRMLKDPTVGRVLTALGYDPAGADLLCRRSGLDFSRVAAVLTELELNDIIQRLDDGRYVRRQQEML